jgi:hypothetical protein
MHLMMMEDKSVRLSCLSVSACARQQTPVHCCDSDGGPLVCQAVSARPLSKICLMFGFL